MSTERVTEEREVTFLVEPKARYVSLVTRGANQIPFKIVKTQDKPRRVDMKKTLQTLIVPASMSNEDILEWVGEEAAEALKLDSTNTVGEYKRFVQLPASKFKSDSMSLVTLDDELGIKAICGELEEGEDNGVISKLFKRRKVVKTVAVEEDETTKEEEVLKSMSYDMYDELYAMSSAITGLLSQEMGSAEEKISAVTTVIDNFVAYLGSALAVTKGQALVAEKKEETKVEDKKKEENREEVETNAKEDVTQTEEKVEDAERQVEDSSTKAEKVEEPESKSEKSEDDSKELNLEKLVEGYKQLSDAVKELSETVSKMQKMVPGIEVPDAPEPAQAKKTSKSDDVFSGVLFK